MKKVISSAESIQKSLGDQIMNLKEEEKIRQIVEKNREIIDAMKRLSDSILEDKTMDENSKKIKQDIGNDINQPSENPFVKMVDNK